MRQDIHSNLLSGTSVTTDSAWASSSPSDGVYYLVETTCGPCALNLPFLERLFQDAGVNVVGVSFDRREDLLKYVQSNDITFPVLYDIKGVLPSLLPGNLSPVTVVVRHDSLDDIVVGFVEAGSQAQIEFAFTRSASKPVAEPGR